MGIRAAIEAALSATAERLSPGSGASVVSEAKNDLSTIGASSENLDSRYADDTILIAAPVVFEAKQPDGDPVRFDKKRPGLVVVYSDSFIFVRGLALGAREVKTVGKSEVDVERVSTVLDGDEVPGLRITAHSGKPKFALAVALAKHPSDPVAQAAIRDELAASITR